MRKTPELRIRALNAAQVSPKGQFVLYWMLAARRAGWNFALDRAIEWARELRKPLVVLEALRCDYPWASDRLHRFVLDGMTDNAERFSGSPALYYPYVEPRKGAGKGLIQSLGQHASVVVTDDSPAFFLPRAVAAAAGRLPVLLEAVDSNGLLPIHHASESFATAFAFRRYLQRELACHLHDLPRAHPLARLALPRLDSLPGGITRRWPRVREALLVGDAQALGELPLDHSVAIAPTKGGTREAEKTLRRFLRQRLQRYQEARNQPAEKGTSGLSPYLHFGHISPHQILAQVAKQEGWTHERLPSRATGSRAGWWGMSEAAEAFVDQLVTWRELGFNTCLQVRGHDRYQSLPEWARRTLDAHATDERRHLYSLEEFGRGQTHDQLWNAAQMQLVRDGSMHNYLRMLWGKKILEWSPSPQQALEVMLELNDRYALDGRDPNSVSGCFWVLGRYDRAWGPERPIFGTIRYMSTASTRRKCKVDPYVERYAPAAS